MMPANATGYDDGDTVLLSLAVDRDVDGTPTPTDATTVTITITNPDGTITTGSLAGGQVEHPGIGAYTYRFAAIAGTMLYRWSAAGTADSKPFVVNEQDQIYVRAAGQRIISLAEAKKALRYPATDLGRDDDEIRDMIDSATAELEKYCGPIVPRTVTQTFYPEPGRYKIALAFFPVLELLDVDGDPAAVADVTADENGIIATTPNFSGVLTYRVGRIPVPPVLRDAAKELVRYWWQGSRQRSAGAPGVRLDPDDYNARSDTPGPTYGMPYAVLDKIGPERMAGVA